MGGPHKRNPIPFRPPEADQLWLMEHAASTGRAVNAILVAALAEYRERHEGDKPVSVRPYPPTHPFAGSDSDRQSIGDPGHCEKCAEFGHVAAHPDLGCGDVGCSRDHDPSEPADIEGKRAHAARHFRRHDKVVSSHFDGVGTVTSTLTEQGVQIVSVRLPANGEVITNGPDAAFAADDLRKVTSKEAQP